MPSSETVNFNRFLTSLGLFLMAASLLIPYFYFRNTDLLSIPQAELEEMTDTGRAAIESRQDHIASLEPWIAGFAVLLFVSGATSAYFGARRLREAQNKEDEVMDHKVGSSRYEFEKLTADEVEKGREQKARETVKEDASEEDERDAGGAPASRVPAPAPRVPAPAKAPAPATPPRPRSSERPVVTKDQLSLPETRAAVERIEDTIGRLFEASDLGSYEFSAQVKVQAHPTGSPVVRLDGLFTPRSDAKGPDVVLDLKLARSPRVPVLAFSDRLLARTVRYRAATSRPTTAWMVVVAPEEAEPVDENALEWTAGRLRPALAGSGRATVIREREIPTLPALFRSLFDA